MQFVPILLIIINLSFDGVFLPLSLMGEGRGVDSIHTIFIYEKNRNSNNRTVLIFFSSSLKDDMPHGTYIRW